MLSPKQAATISLALMACALLSTNTSIIFRRQARTFDMYCARTICLALVLLLPFSLVLTVDAKEAEDGDPGICVQGLSTAKRTLQATQRNAQRVVMSSAAGKVGQFVGTMLAEGRCKGGLI